MPDADPFAAADMQDTGAAQAQPAAPPNPVMSALFGSKGPGAFPGEAVEAFTDVPKEVLRQLNEAGAQWRADVTQPDKSKTPGEEAGFNVKMLGDFFNVPGSILTGLATSVAGRPVEMQTGIPRETVGNIVALATPFLGDVNDVRAATAFAKKANIPIDSAYQILAKLREARVPKTTTRMRLAQNVATLKRAGVRPNLALAASTRGTRVALQNLAKSQIIGGGAVRRGITHASEALEGTAHDIAGRNAKGGFVTSPAEAGERIKQGVTRFAAGSTEAARTAREGLSPEARDAMESAARATPSRRIGFGVKADILYERADRLVKTPHAPIDTPNFNAAVADSLHQFESPELSEVFRHSKLEDIAKALEQRKLTFDDARLLRTKIRERLKSDETLRGTLDEAQIDHIYSALTDDLRNAAYKLGGEEAGEAYDEANRFYRAGNQRVRNALQRVFESDSGSDVFFDMLNSAQEGSKRNLERLSQVKNSLSPDEWRDFSATVLEKMGTAIPSTRSWEQQFSLSTFLTNFNKLDTAFGKRGDSVSDSGLKLLFSGAGRSEDFDRLQAIASSAGMFRDWTKYGNPAGTASPIIDFGSVALAAAEGIHNPLGTILALSVGQAAMYGIMSEKFVRWLAKLPTTGDANDIEKAMGELGDIAKHDPDVRPIYHQLATGLMPVMVGAHALVTPRQTAPRAEDPADNADPFSDPSMQEGAPVPASGDPPSAPSDDTQSSDSAAPTPPPGSVDGLRSAHVDPTNLKAINVPGGAGAVRVNAVIAPFVEDFLIELGSRYPITKVVGVDGHNTDVAGTGVESAHHAGLAIDVNPRENEGANTQFDPDFVRRLCAKYGCKWGHDFHKADSMHFAWSSASGGAVPWAPAGMGREQVAAAGPSDQGAPDTSAAAGALSEMAAFENQ